MDRGVVFGSDLDRASGKGGTRVESVSFTWNRGACGITSESSTRVGRVANEGSELTHQVTDNLTIFTFDFLGQVG